MEPARESWSNRFEYILVLIGYTVGLGNILRFPYLALYNGGGAFLIPYTICLFVCGMPLYYLELAIGHCSGKSCLTCWPKFAPIMKSIGFVMVFVQLVHGVEYHTCTTWIIHYLAASLTWTLPWSSCNQTWNTELCIVTRDNDSLTTLISNTSLVVMNTTRRSMSAAEEYWENYVLDITDGISNLGGIHWQLCIAHIVGWGLVFVCVFRGVRSVGKVVWVTATAPYVLLTVFIIRASTLPGSADGIRYYLSPDFDKLKEPRVWMQAFLQIFYSLGPGWGGILAMASYNKRNHSFTFEAILVPIINCLTSFMAGFVVFSSIGFLAHTSGVSVEDSVTSGPGLAFVTYPEIAAQLPWGFLWSFLFFLMLLSAALDTEFVALESTIGSLQEQFKIPQNRKCLLTLALVIFNLMIGLIFTTRASMYIFQLIDWYVFSVAIFFTAASECMGVVWLYGFERLQADICSMTSRKLPKMVFLPLWGVIIPLMLVVGMVWTLAELTCPTFGAYEYPRWACNLGVFLSICPILPAFVYIVWNLFQFRGMNFRTKLRSFIETVETKVAPEDWINCEPIKG